MRESVKLTFAISGFVMVVITSLGICYFFYYRDSQLSKYHTAVGEKLLYAKKTSEAINKLEKALELNSRNDEAERKLFETYMESKQYEKAILMLQTQMKRAPDEFLNYVRNNKLAYIFININKVNDAKKIYESMLPKYSLGSGVYLGLATCYEKEGDVFTALGYQKKAVDIMKNNPKFTSKSKLKKELQKLFELYRKVGQEELANKVAQEIAEIK